MEMGKFTAKLRDAVPVCLPVEVKRYQNIEIPDALKVLEYKNFKFDVPLYGAIIFKIMLEPSILPEEWTQARERKTGQPMPQGTEPQVMASAEAAEKAAPQEAQPAEAPPETVETLAQALADAQAAAEPVDAVAEAVADGEPTKAEITGNVATGRVLVITAEPEIAEATAQPESDSPTEKPAPKGKGKKGVETADNAAK